MSGPVRLECRDVSLRFGGVAALADVSISIEPGVVTAIMGPNGAGKTTLLNCISGILTTHAGSIALGQQVVTSLPPHLRTKRGLVRSFQLTKVFGSLTIEENIVVAAAAVDIALSRSQCDEIIDLTKLERMRQRGASELSGGQRRLLEIGVCLAQDPRFLLMDEPFAGLNPMMVNVICDVIQFLAKRGVGVVLISHEIPIVRKHADRVIVMAQGAVLVDGPPDAALSDRRVVESYIGGGIARH
jgi:ABC-type branched-subunit amino acid transport system ATPase component